MHSNTVQDSSVRVDISATASIEALPRMMEPQIDKRQTDLLFALPAMIFGHAMDLRNGGTEFAIRSPRQSVWPLS